MKQQLGTLAYHFWTKSMDKINLFRKKTDPDPLHNVVSELPEPLDCVLSYSPEFLRNRSNPKTALPQPLLKPQYIHIPPLWESRIPEIRCAVRTTAQCFQFQASERRTIRPSARPRRIRRSKKPAAPPEPDWIPWENHRSFEYNPGISPAKTTSPDMRAGYSTA